ncbi:Bug family tripartite tricarboxylate transporter substrate binding protein [Lacisediminimonas profundi]|uniref:Bug family tripartite tricarboxylate transporter substrate binding protein n=1 Tax=Lacisediminimonas profundi TaxID=2603856 RepID=UPI001F4F5812|nr:tripartite tricarboxylate transporter substrate binding protein [Lacisediminimonas profundi]
MLSDKDMMHKYTIVSRTACRLAVTFGLLLSAAPVLAQEWPSRPIHMIVPFGPGSTPDLLARTLAEKLTSRLGKPIIVENKSGAGGNVGTGLVAKAAPDGYTIGVTISGPLAANTILYKNLSYQPQRDIAPVSIAATQPSVLVVPSRLNIRTAAELLAALRANPGKFNYSSMGSGSISHLAVEALAAQSATELVHVPYASSGQAVTALLAGDTQLAVLPAAAVMAQVKAGKLNALAVATARRSAVVPELPTLSEAGIRDVQADAWMGVIAPAKTPAAILSRLQNEVIGIMRAEDVRQKLQALWMEPVGSTPAEFSATVQADLERWRPIIRKHNIVLD